MRVTNNNIPNPRMVSNKQIVTNQRHVHNKQQKKKGSKKSSESKKSATSDSSFFKFLSSEGMIKVYGLLLLAFALLLLVSMVSYFFGQKADTAHVSNHLLPPHNIARSVGAHIAYFFTNYLFGVSSLGFVALFSLYGLRMLGFSLSKTEEPLSLSRWTFSILVTMAWISFALGFFVHASAYQFIAGDFGCFTATSLLTSVGKLVSALICVVSFLIIMILCYHFSVKDGFSLVGNGIIALFAKLFSPKEPQTVAASPKENPSKSATSDTQDLDPLYVSNLNGLKSGINDKAVNFSPTSPTPTPPFDPYHFPSDDEPKNDDKIPLPWEADPALDTLKIPEPKKEEEKLPWEVETPVQKPEEPGGIANQQIDDKPRKTNEETPVDFEIIKTLPTKNENEEENEEEPAEKDSKETPASIDPRLLEPYDPCKDLSMYKFPDLNLLNDCTNKAVSEEAKRKELIETKTLIENTLKSFKIEIVKISAIIGPTVTLYEIVPAPGIRISKIKNLEDDIALSLSALGIRIIAPIPGKGTIGIEVPNKNPNIVSMKELITCEKFQNAKYELPIALGKTISNEPFIADLAKMPHLLMAGATGQGKSVGLNAIITSLLYKKHPAELKMVLIDPKKVEFSLYSAIEKHYLAKLPDEEHPIITDVKKVIRTLNSLCTEMDERYDLLQAAKARNIKEYNAKFCRRELSPTNGHRHLPYIVLVIDEFGDLIMTAGREVEHPIARLAQLARAIGIHLIIATQRPSVKIISGNIKANFPARIAFRVMSRVDSLTILDATGADQLIGKGDMLISTGSDLLRLQCAFVDTPEVEAIVNHISDQPSYPEAFMLPECAEDEAGDNFDEMQGMDNLKIDPCFMDAATLIVQSQVGSTSLLQRRMNLGYNRAGRLMDQLAEFKIVGEARGSKPREVLVPTVEELKVIFNRMGLI